MKRPIVQSKDCTDTGRVRDTQRPKLEDGGVVPCSIWPPVTRAVGRGREDRTAPSPPLYPHYWVTGSQAISNDQGEYSRRPSTPRSKPLKCMRSPRLASAVYEPSVSSSSLATLLPPPGPGSKLGLDEVVSGYEAWEVAPARVPQGTAHSSLLGDP